MNTLKRLACTLLVVGMVLNIGLLSVSATASKTYPSKPINVIVPWAAGGGTDVVARGFLKVAEKHVGTTIYVTNVTGGNGAVGWRTAATASPDGYTLAMLTIDILTHSASANPPVSFRDFVPLATVSQYPVVIAVAKEAPWKNFKEFMDYARQNPGKVRISNNGFGNYLHQTTIMLEQATGLSFTAVPFDGATPSIAAVLGGNVEAVAATVPEIATRPDMRMLVQLADERHPEAKDVPTTKEYGIDVRVSSFRMLAAPKNAPPEVVKYLEGKFREAWNDPEFQAWAAKTRACASYLSSKDSQQLLDSLYTRIKDIVQKLDL